MINAVDCMVSNSKNYYLEQMSLETKKVVLSILLKKQTTLN